MDEVDLSVGWIPKIAGVLQIAAGATCLVQGIQLWTLFVFWNWMWVLPYVLVPAGLAQMALGAWASAGRDWAAVGGTTLTWALAMGALAFTAWSLLSGFIALAFVWSGLGVVASLVAPLAIPRAIEVSQARRALYGS